MHIIIFVLQNVYCALCDLVDVPEFYEEACDCPDCTPTCCQGKWHIKIPIYFDYAFSGFISIYMFRTISYAMQTLE